MTDERVKLDTINVSDYAYITEIMHQILYSEARSNSGCLMGELIGVSGHSDTINRSHIEIQNAVVRYSNVTIKVKKGKVVIYTDMMTEILTNGMANRLANWSDSLVKDWDINPTNDLYAYHKSLIPTDDMLNEFHTAIILDYTDMVSILLKKEK